MMYVGSLFSGIGGIELGFQRQGFKTRWFIECDKYARSILEKNFPKTPIYDDITTVDFRTVPKVDILTGGFPCQDISLAGKGVGISGSKSSLWKYYKEAIREIRPRFAFIENVPAIIGRGLDVVLSDLAEVGYDAEWYNLSASAVGAFHKRERLFIIAYLQESRNRGLSVQQRNQRKEGVDVDGCCKVASDTNCNRRSQMSKRQFNKNDTTWYENKLQKEVIPNSNSKRQQKQWRKKSTETTRTRFEYNIKNANSDIGSLGMWKLGVLQKNSDGFIETESRVCGVVDGVPHRVDRIRCLGNSVVPQVAEVFAQAIKEYGELN